MCVFVEPSKLTCPASDGANSEEFKFTGRPEPGTTNIRVQNGRRAGRRGKGGEDEREDREGGRGRENEGPNENNISN